MQIIWLRETATAFAAQCEACHHDRAWPPVVIRGELRAEADVGFVTCWRGHRVRVRRMPRARVEAEAQAVRT
jgi:hypothetical protein